MCGGGGGGGTLTWADLGPGKGRGEALLESSVYDVEVTGASCIIEVKAITPHSGI